MSEGSWVPKTWSEAIPYIVWGVLAFAFGFEGVGSLIHGDLWPAVFGIGGMLGLAAMLIHWVKVRDTFSDLRWLVAAMMLGMVVVAFSPFIEEKRWPFSSWFPPSPTLDQTASAVAEKLVGRIPSPPSADEIADAVIRKMPKQAAPEAEIVHYGINGPQQFYALVNIGRWEDYKEYKAVLIMRTVYADRDRETDDWISKSIPYTIDGPTLIMGATNKDQMHFSPGVNTLEYNFAVIPLDKAPEQVRMLQDVVKLGGKILAVKWQQVPLSPVPPKN